MEDAENQKYHPSTSVYIFNAKKEISLAWIYGATASRFNCPNLVGTCRDHFFQPVRYSTLTHFSLFLYCIFAGV